MNNQYNILLTGATGVLGSHILFELLHQYANDDRKGKIILLVRKDKKNVPEERIRNILQSPFIPDKLKAYPLESLLRHLTVIESGLNDFSVSMLPMDARELTVIHAAASVNLGRNESAEAEIHRNNFLGTRHLLQELAPRIRKFVFVSTAYSSGHRSGEIANDFLSVGSYQFRNPYEYFKHETEMFVKDYCSSRGIEWSVIRPSIICGRFIDAPLYVIPRFMVFYLFARYAFNLRSRLENTYLQLHVPSTAFINIVPVDYVAKITIASLNQHIEQLNVVHQRNVSCRCLFTKGFNLIHFKNFTFCEDMPKEISPVEKCLYTTIGQQLGPYMDTPGHYFDTSALQKLMPGVSIPETEDHFCGLLDFAASRNFAPLY